MKNIFKVALLGGLLVASSNAKDLLNFATNGTANKSEVKILTDNEMKDAKGGYITSGIINIGNKAIVIALPDFNNEIMLRQDENGRLVQLEPGLCSIGKTECYYNKNTQSHLQQNKNRMQEYANAFLNTYNYRYHGLVYTVTREIKTSDRGVRYPLFTYGVEAYNRLTGTFHKINSSAVLNNNMIIRELRDNYKVQMENGLGVW
ncbi:bacteriocin-type signal sequence domain-containing protein [Campylobacter concisus]|uniref:bacteriocin-type signal sequence domain-containing protein n=1 Tax=Campylobacter concisus TaxID=199 RepID=UPI000B3D596D|nr:bacteriocin-type signal sequence domain-containing protein [Campylobacter concisus]OUT12608.1 bacteriocin-type signal sequence domain-containing protein [Campylobacter concisus]